MSEISKLTLVKQEKWKRDNSRFLGGKEITYFLYHKIKVCKSTL